MGPLYPCKPSKRICAERLAPAPGRRCRAQGIARPGAGACRWSAAAAPAAASARSGAAPTASCSTCHPTPLAPLSNPGHRWWTGKEPLHFYFHCNQEPAQREDAASLSSHRHAVSFCTILFYSTRFEFHPCIAEGCCVSLVACAKCRVATSCVLSGGYIATPCKCNMFMLCCMIIVA